MLVLKRKAGESVTVSGQCIVHVLGIEGKQVKLGFEGEGTRVIRTELITQKEDEQYPQDEQ